MLPNLMRLPCPILRLEWGLGYVDLRCFGIGSRRKICAHYSSIVTQVVYGTTEMGATPQLSWIAVLGYSLGSAFPAVLLCWLGPQVRAMSEEAFSTTDFGLKRYGRLMQLVISCLSGFYMFIFIVAELTAVSNIFGLLTNNPSTKYRIGVALIVGVFTTFYTTIAGTPASIVTDKIQGVMMAILVILLTLAVTINPDNSVTASEFAVASNWTLDGFYAAVTLVLAIASAEMFNQGGWQRVWAAESIPTLRKGLCMGSVMIFFLMMFFGVMGMLAYAKDPEAYNDGTKYAYLSFFDLLEPLKNGWHILTLILVTALCSSTVDTLQNGLASIFSHDALRTGYSPQWIARGLIVLINIPAIYLASKAYSVLSLFLVADLVCATSVCPVFLGLQKTDRRFLTAPTELGAFLGCITGIVTVLINGLINNADGGLFEYFWLRNGAICALCGTKTMVSFIITPVMSVVGTYSFSYLDVLFRGERARQPVVRFAFDEKKQDEKNLEDADEGDEEVPMTNVKELDGDDKHGEEEIA
jgi:solute:Na+ symporter, SSS family